MGLHFFNEVKMQVDKRTIVRIHREAGVPHAIFLLQFLKSDS